ncbi:uncharacterized protein G2W53_031365 [Senna tora]|uniref:Uncharacterized protein n=1 Tax=Senna tora TaxID=362788 RepID=A0A834TAI9_9FABA|nr:uncharacterized protein G2W53_031365 [Senna tora]
MNETPLSPAQNRDIVPVPFYHSLLKESIDHFIAKYQDGVTDFCDFSSIFSRLLQNLPDPPLQIVWFYSALGFHTTKIAVRRESSARAAIAKDLFQLLVSCSEYCGSNSMKRIGILAPFVYELYHLVLEEKGLKCEVESLLEGLISYCSLFCGKELHEDSDGMNSLEPSFLDVIPVWMVDQSGVRDYLKEFFPIISDQLRRGIKLGCEIGFLAGIVMCEALLLKLCLKFELGITKAEQEKKLHGLAVQIITGFRNFYFLDALSRMMLEPVLPVVSLLGCENEVLLKGVLFNALMMVEYPFITPQAGVLQHAKSLKDFALTWLFVADLAIQSARGKGDQEKAMSYVNAFSRSCIPIQLINWVTSQSSVGGKISHPNVSTPVALIKWLLVVEDQGLTVFDGDTAKLRIKAKYFTSTTEHLLPFIQNSCYNTDKNLFLHSLHGGTEEDKLDANDIEMADPMDTMVLNADDRMNTTSTNGTRKRKEEIVDETKTQVKFMRCQFQENSVRENSIVFRQTIPYTRKLGLVSKSGALRSLPCLMSLSSSLSHVKFVIAQANPATWAALGFLSGKQTHFHENGLEYMARFLRYKVLPGPPMKRLKETKLTISLQDQFLQQVKWVCALETHCCLWDLKFQKYPSRAMQLKNLIQQQFPDLSIAHHHNLELHHVLQKALNSTDE